jgi:hypothetical protein
LIERLAGAYGAGELPEYMLEFDLQALCARRSGLDPVRTP